MDKSTHAMGGHNKCTSACNGGGRVRFLLNSYYLNDLILCINCIDKKISAILAYG